MANNRFQVRRSSVPGKIPTTSELNIGEIGLNLTDQIMYSTNGTVVFEIGANNTNSRVSNTLIVKAISANGANGSSGQVLTTNGTAAYWSTVSGSGTVTQVNTGNGMTGGPVTATGTISVLANTGIVSSSDGVFVNATYIGTISANNASFLGGTAAASYVQNTDSRTLSGNLTFSGANVNFTGNARITGGLIANGSLGTAADVLKSNGSSVYWAPAAGGGSGALSYTANVGNNSNNTFDIAHGLNTMTIIPAVREIATGYYVYPDMKVTSSNNIVLEFVSAPTANQYFLILLGA